MAEARELVYVHDPMCSWCWGFRPTLDRLLASLPATYRVRTLLGGLAPDSTEPMPQEMRHYLQDTWRRIQQRIPGTRFNFGFWQQCTPRRSTWPACRAVIAAREQDPAMEWPMIGAIQQAYYLQARNPSDDTTLIALAAGLGLDEQAFAQSLNAGGTQRVLDSEIAEARRIGADSFPSLRIGNGKTHRPLTIDYTRVEPMLAQIRALSADPG